MIGVGVLFGYQFRNGSDGEPAIPESGYYPDVAPVPLTQATGSIVFPEYNGRVKYSSSRPEQTINDPRVVFTQALPSIPPSATDIQFIVIASLPREKQSNFAPARGLFGNVSVIDTNGTPGNTLQQLGLWVTDTGRMKGKMHVGASMVETGLNTVPGAFVAAFTNSAGSQQICVTEMETGNQVLSGTGTGTWGVALPSRTYTLGGAAAISEAELMSSKAMTFWSGGYEAFYMLVGARLSPEQLRQIATRAARPQDILPIANVVCAREGGENGFVKPAWATADTTSATVKLGATPVISGSPLARRAAADLVVPARVLDHHVYALLPNETERDVPFSFTASGSVEVQIYDAESGKVVRDWTALAAYDGNTASGQIKLPRGDHGWYRSRYRLVGQTAVAGHGPVFGVGYRLKALGQSQVAYGLGGENPAAFVLNPNAKVCVAGGSSPGTLRLELVGGNARTDSYVTFANTWAKLAGKVPVMIVHGAIPGTGIAEMLYDSDTVLSSIYSTSRGRGWQGFASVPNEQPLLDAFGTDYTAIIWSWLTNDNDPVNFPRRMGALLYGDFSGLQVVPDHSFATALTPGYAVIHMPALRGAGSSDPHGGAGIMAPWAIGKNQVMALPSQDMISRYNEPGHVSAEHVRAAARFGKAMAFGLARATGRTTLTNPYWTNARRTAPNVIMVDFIAANGGTLSIPGNATAIHSWGWSLTGTDNSWNWNDGTVTQTISGNSIVLTKTDGNWPANVHVAYHTTACPNVGTSLPSGYGPSEWWAHQNAVMDGICYETWADDPLGLGLPIVGSMTGGVWTPIFETPVA